MIIERTQTQNSVKFSDIKVGEVFDWDDEIMMRTIETCDDEGDDINAVDLQNGELYSLHCDTNVTRISAKLIIS